MRTSPQDPPHNIRELCEQQFDLTNHKPVWTYGDTIYNPHLKELDGAIVTHEEVHEQQQGKAPAQWWTDYLEDPNFRFSQELAAYQAQYQFAKAAIKDRNQLAKYLYAIASDLSGGMYGRLFTLDECMRLIKRGV